MPGFFNEVRTKVSLATGHLENMIKSPEGMVTNADGTPSWLTAEAHEYDTKDDGWKQSGTDD